MSTIGDESNTRAARDEEKKRSTLCRMAGNVFGGLNGYRDYETFELDERMEEMAKDAVEIAHLIYNEIHSE